MSRIYWDAGHGGSDPGAVGYVKEKDVAIKVVKYGCDYMRNSYKCDVYQDITADSTTTISNRANRWGAKLFISVHFNAGGGDGYEALVYSAANKKLGQTFEKRVKAIGQNSRGVKYRPDLNVLRSTKMPAILNEIAFVDNKKDIKDWDENAELKRMGIALAKAAADFLNLEVKKKEESFKVEILVNALNVRSGPGLKYKANTQITDRGIYTIIDTSGSWGKLKSGNGWINISESYCKKV